MKFFLKELGAFLGDFVLMIASLIAVYGFAWVAFVSPAKVFFTDTVCILMIVGIFGLAFLGCKKP